MRQNQASAEPDPPSRRASAPGRNRRLARLRRLLRIVIAAGPGLAPLAAGAEGLIADFDRVMLQYGPYTYHYNKSVEHNDAPHLIGIELEKPSRFLLGASFFTNSFYQPSAYIYFGKRWFFAEDDQGFYGKLTAGPLVGYRGQYEDKVPLNHDGVAPAIVPGLGYQYRRANAQFVVLGASGFLLTFGFEVPQ